MEITALILLIFGAIISVGLTSILRYAIGIKDDHTTDESAILFEVFTIKALHKFSEIKSTPNMMLTNILKRRSIIKPFGFCSVCTCFWISILVGVSITLTSTLNLFWCVILFIGIVALSHLIIKK